MEMVGLPMDELIELLHVALCGHSLPPEKVRQYRDLLARLSPHKTNQRASLDKPTGTAETIVIDKTLEQASSVSAMPSWSVSKAHG